MDWLWVWVNTRWRDPAEGGDGDGIRRIMCPSVTKENKGENQRIINQSFHDVTRCVSFYVSKKKNPRRKRKTRKNNTRSHSHSHFQSPRKESEKQQKYKKTRREKIEQEKKEKYLFAWVWQTQRQIRRGDVDGDARGRGMNCEAWAVPRKWRQYLLKDAPIYILRSCWLAECEGRTQRPVPLAGPDPNPNLTSFLFHLPHSILADKRHTQVTARAVDKKWNYVDKKSSIASSRAKLGAWAGTGEPGQPGSGKTWAVNLLSVNLVA